MKMSIGAKEVVRMVKLKSLVQTTRGSMTAQRVRVVYRSSSAVRELTTGSWIWIHKTYYYF